MRILNTVICLLATVSAFAIDPGSTSGFTENKGQITNEGVLFSLQWNGTSFFVTEDGLDFVHYERVGEDQRTISSRSSIHVIGAAVERSNVIKNDAIAGYSNFYYSHCPQGILGVRTFSRLTFISVYPGIDWVLSFDPQNGLEHDFILHPGADPGLIRLEYSGDDLVNSSDLIHLRSGNTSITEGPLHAFNSIDLTTVAAAFKVDRNTGDTWNVSYELAAYDHNATIIIDPPLQWSSPQSSSEFDQGFALAPAKDGSGDVMITGSSEGTDFPDTLAWQGTLAGPMDAVVIRLDANGQRKWSTYYGGSDIETGHAIATDISGLAYVTGTTRSSGLPLLNEIQDEGGGRDVFFITLDAQGVLGSSTYFGGLINDDATAIAVGPANEIYICGFTNSEDLPVAGDPIQPVKDASNDGFILKLSSPSQVEWCTYFGGNDDDKIRAIAIDESGNNIYLTGSTTSSTFPTTNGVFQPFSGSGLFAEDAFVTRIDASQVLQFSGYFGGSDADFGQAISVGANGAIHVTGYSFSPDLPITDPLNGAYMDSTYNGVHDAFIMRCNNSGSSRTWSTYFGGMSSDLALGIAERGGKILITGKSNSTDLPVLEPSDGDYYQPVQSDGGNYNDMFIAWFDETSALAWSTYYGTTDSNDEAHDIAIGDLGEILVTGVSTNDLAALKFSSDITIGITDRPFITDLQISPMPATDRIEVRFPNSVTDVDLSLYDQKGKLVWKDSFVNATIINVDLSALAPGTYLLNATGPGLAATDRVIKMK
jgi:hypothetical protein